MSGVFQPDFRQGNISEYLAQYLLSYLGSSIYVPRQEDVGIDFNCAISENDGQLEVTKEQFYVQIKSNLTDEIEYGSVVKTGKNNKCKWKKYELDWLFNLDNPLFIGVLNKDEGSLELYSTSFMWHNYWNKKFLTIKFIPNQPNQQMEEIHAIDDLDISDWAEELDTEIPKKKTLVQMGPPIIKLTNDIVRGDITELNKIKNIFRKAIMIEKSNIIYKNLNLPYFNWLHRISTNDSFVGGWFYTISKVIDEEEKLYQSLSPILIALALLYKKTQDSRFETILNVLKLVPTEYIPIEVKVALELK
jgi:hypothetical protein